MRTDSTRLQSIYDRLARSIYNDTSATQWRRLDDASHVTRQTGYRRRVDVQDDAQIRKIGRRRLEATYGRRRADLTSEKKTEVTSICQTTPPGQETLRSTNAFPLRENPLYNISACSVVRKKRCPKNNDSMVLPNYQEITWQTWSPRERLRAISTLHSLSRLRSYTGNDKLAQHGNVTQKSFSHECSVIGKILSWGVWFVSYLRRVVSVLRPGHLATFVSDRRSCTPWH